MDYRDRLATFGNGRTLFDESSMTLFYNEGDENEFSVPARFDVCPSCEGRGKYVNPSVDSQGLSAEELLDDPSFAEDYFRGAYDVICEDCKGERVVPVPDEEDMTLDMQLRLDEYESERAHSVQERICEIAFGY